MQTFTRTTIVNRTPAKVFAALTDLDRAHHYAPDIVNIERLDDGSFDVGTRWNETRRIKLFGLLPVAASTTIEVTDYERNKHYTTLCADDHGWVAYTFKVRSAGAGKTKVDLLGEFKGVGKWEGNEGKARSLAKWYERSDGDLLEHLKASIE